MNKLRLLNFDDIYLLKFLREGLTLTAAAKELNLTQPALTQRIRKIESIFEQKILEKSGRQLALTKEGVALCEKAADILTLIETLSPTERERVINVGTRPEAGRSWLWPAIDRLRSKHPNLTIHLHFGSGEEVLSQMSRGRLDGVLTSAPLTAKNYRSIELAREEYWLVAAPDAAKTIKSIEDLAHHILIEHDRSFPFMRYVDPNVKARLKYRDVWFLESTEIMCSAIQAGYGVGIVPAYVVKVGVKEKRLKRLRLFDLSHDHFRLIYRAHSTMDEPMQLLADSLKRVGLKA